jgi:2-polyprenyl-3-methyl-5-hydroxy-6-metoxy-1,4-benzoquinol methylase
MAVRDVEQYWRDLIRGGDTDHVEEVGHPDMGREFNRHAYDVRLRAIERALTSPDVRVALGGARVFEAAYGVGFYLKYWGRKGAAHVTGVDISESAHESVSKRFPSHDLRLGDLSKMTEWADWASLQRSFDLVTAIDVLYHVVNDDAAERAVAALATLVRPGGYFLFTEKFTGLDHVDREQDIVTRRPLAWYRTILKRDDLVEASVSPMFWCMDPPVDYGGEHRLSQVLARGVWIGMRAALKYWRRNSTSQNIIGTLTGRLGGAVDNLVVPRLSVTPNLAVAIFRKSSAVERSAGT